MTIMTVVMMRMMIVIINYAFDQHSLLKPSTCMSMADLKGWFLAHADRETCGRETHCEGKAISVRALTRALPKISGEGLPFPNGLFEELSNRKNRRELSEDMLRRQIERAFSRRALPMPEGPVHGMSFSFEEVLETIWDLMARKIDELMLHTVLGPRHKKQKVAVGEHVSTPWPSTEEESGEWASASLAMIKAMPAAESAEQTHLDAVVADIAETCVGAIGLRVDANLLRAHFGPVCTMVEPSAFLAATLLRTDMLSEMIGNCLAIRLRLYCFSIDWCIVSVWNGVGNLQDAVQELLESRQQLLEIKAANASGHVASLRELCGPSKVLTSAKRNELCLTKQDTRTTRYSDKRERTDKTLAVCAEAVVGLNTTLKAAPGAFELGFTLAQPDRALGTKLDEIADRYELSNGILLLDQAVDEYMKDVFAKARGNGTLRGWSFTSDESPSIALRYAGLRFQITHLYAVIMMPREVWELPEYKSKMPIRRVRQMCDICNCPDKSGEATYNVIVHQVPVTG